MKIVHIEDFFHPNAGYQINIIPKYMVNEGHEVYIITSELEKIPDGLTNFFGKDNIIEDDRRYTKETGVNIIRIPIKRYISGRVIFTDRIFKVVNEINADILYIHGNDTWTGMKFLMKYKKIKCPIIMDSHMLEMASTNPFNKVFRYIYRKTITPIIIKNNIKVIRTQNDNYVQKCLGIPIEQSPWISVGSDTLLFNKNSNIRKRFREENNIDNDDFVIVYTGKLDEAKGGKFLAEGILEKFKSIIYKNIVILIVGNSTGEYGNEVDEILNKSENRIIRYKTQKYIDLAKFYQIADLCVFPKQCSLSFYDAQACGLPVLSEDNNINIDRLKYNNGFNFRANDLEDFRNSINKCINMGKEEYKKISENSLAYVCNNYNYKSISAKYLELICEEVNSYGKGE